MASRALDDPMPERLMPFIWESHLKCVNSTGQNFVNTVKPNYVLNLSQSHLPVKTFF